MEPSPDPHVLNLPVPILERILALLPLQDIGRVAQSCKQLQAVARSNSLWLNICQGRWGNDTNVASWRTDKPCGCFALIHQYRELAPLTYRRCDGGNSILCRFSWAANSIQATTIQEGSMHTPAQSTRWLTLSPEGTAMPANISTRPSTNVIMRDYSSSREALFSPAAEAAAAVACSGTRHQGSDSSGILGSSPEGSFDFEMLRFMQDKVAGSRKARRRSSGGSHGQWMEAEPVLLTSVRRPLPTRAHPLAGLFKGVYGAFGVQVLAVEYSFVGPAARICATKVAGRGMVPGGPGEVSWTAAAAPLPQPWPTREAAMVAMRWNLARGDDHLLSSQSDVHLREEDKQVVACFKGQGLVAGGMHRREVDGRLWLYDTGDIGFVWLDDLQFLVDFQRVDSSYV